MEPRYEGRFTCLSRECRVKLMTIMLMNMLYVKVTKFLPIFSMSFSSLSSDSRDRYLRSKGLIALSIFVCCYSFKCHGFGTQYFCHMKRHRLETGWDFNRAFTHCAMIRRYQSACEEMRCYTRLVKRWEFIKGYRELKNWTVKKILKFEKRKTTTLSTIIKYFC